MRQQYFFLLIINCTISLLFSCVTTQIPEPQKQQSEQRQLSAIDNWTLQIAKSKSRWIEKRSDCFIGLGLGIDKKKSAANQKARLTALSDLTSEISIDVRSLIDRYQREMIVNGKVQLEDDYMSNIRETYGDVRLRQVSYEIQDRHFDKQSNTYCIAVIALKNRQEYFNDYVTLIRDDQYEAFRGYIHHFIETLKQSSVQE